MANMSTAAGSVTLVTDTKEHAVQIFEALNKHLNQGDYYTEFFTNPLTLKKESDTSCTVECDFEGSGRWCYESNVKNLGLWCEQDELLTELPWSMTFDFNDEETGFLCHEVLEVAHEAGQNLKKIIYKEINYTDYTRDVFSLYKIMGYDAIYLSETFQLGKEFIYEYSDAEEYEDYRKECLEAAASSYIALENDSATQEEAEEYILKNFSFFEPFPTAEEK